MSKEFEKFDRAMRELIKVPHSEIAKELEKEKRAKAAKKQKRGASSRASRAKR